MRRRGGATDAPPGAARRPPSPRRAANVPPRSTRRTRDGESRAEGRRATAAAKAAAPRPRPPRMSRRRAEPTRRRSAHARARTTTARPSPRSGKAIRAPRPRKTPCPRARRRTPEEHTAVVEASRGGRSPTTPTLCARQRPARARLAPHRLRRVRARADERTARNTSPARTRVVPSGPGRRRRRAKRRVSGAFGVFGGARSCERREHRTSYDADGVRAGVDRTSDRPELRRGNSTFTSRRTSGARRLKTPTTRRFRKTRLPRAVANEKTFGDASSIDSNVAVHSVTIDPIESPRATETQIDSESPGILNARVPLAYDAKRAQRWCWSPNTRWVWCSGAAARTPRTSSTTRARRSTSRGTLVKFRARGSPSSRCRRLRAATRTQTRRRRRRRTKKKKQKRANRRWTRSAAVGVHLLGSETATANAAAMIARLVETSTHRIDRTSAQTARLRRERDRVATRAMLPPIGFAADASSPFGEPNVGESNATPFSKRPRTRTTMHSRPRTRRLRRRQRNTPR